MLLSYLNDNRKQVETTRCVAKLNLKNKAAGEQKMGISCEISLCKPEGEGYAYHPGSVVSGGIRYSLDEDYEFTVITVSLKGYGKLYFEDGARNRRDRQYKFFNTATYADINNIIHQNENKKPLLKGQYETQFSFQLPFDIPASLDYTRRTASDYARCTIEYFVVIEFKRPGWFQFDKHYEKVIKVISGQTPRMTMTPLIYGDQKKLGSLFSIKKGIVKLKAKIDNSVLRPKETIKVDYDVENHTDVEIQRVQIKLLEVDTYFLSRGRNVKVQSEIECTGFMYGAVQSGDTAKFTAEIVIPSLCASIDNAKIISRDYAVLTSVVLPVPHDNIKLEIPFQVINRRSGRFNEGGTSTDTVEHYLDDAPPSYWEVMGEENNETVEEEKPAFKYEETKNN